MAMAMRLKGNILKQDGNPNPYERYTLQYYEYDVDCRNLILIINYKVYVFSDIEGSSNNLPTASKFFDNRFQNLNENNFTRKTQLSKITEWKDVLDKLIFEKNELFTDLSDIGYYIEFMKYIGDDNWSQPIHKFEGFRVKTNNLNIDYLCENIKVYDELKYISHYLMNINKNQLMLYLNGEAKNDFFLEFDDFKVTANYLKYHLDSIRSSHKEIILDELKSTEYWCFSINNEVKNITHSFTPSKILNGEKKELLAYPLNYPSLRKKIIIKHSTDFNKQKIEDFKIEDYKPKIN
jgi:hypothetical protein